MVQTQEIIHKYDARRETEIDLLQALSAVSLGLYAKPENEEGTVPLPTAQLFRHVAQGREYHKHVKSTVCDFLNDYFSRYCEVDASSYRVDFLETDHTKGACGKAEYHFVNTYKQICLSRQTPDFHPVLSVIHDEDATPLILRKYHDASTGLLLSSAVMDNELPLPAGTIVQVPDLARSHQTGEALGTLPDSLFRSYGVSGEEFKCAPLRLSSWAYKDGDYRELFAVTQESDNKSVSLSRRYQCMRYNIDMFRQAADTLLSRCVTI